MKQFDYNKYLKSNPLLKEDTANFRNGKMYIDRSPSQRTYIKGAGKNIKDLNYTLSSLESVYNIKRQDMEALVQIIKGVISNGSMNEAKQKKEYGGEIKKLMKEYDKDSGPQMEELLKALKDIQEKNKEIKAVGVKTLEKMITDLESEIKRLPNMNGNMSQYNNN